MQERSEQAKTRFAATGGVSRASSELSEGECSVLQKGKTHGKDAVVTGSC